MLEKVLIPDKLPVVNLTASSMVFPDVISQVFLRSSSGGKILEDAMDGKCPLVFAVMSQPDVKDIPDRFYNTGVVASLEVVPDDFSVLLRGLYRARVLDWERNIASDDEESYWMAKVGKFEDRREELFIEKDKELVAHPDSRLSFRVAFSKLKKLLERFVEAAGENDAGGIGAILDNFENYDFSKKFSMDQLIWALLSVIPEAIASEKQAVLVSNSVLERIGAVSGLLSENIAMLQMGSEFDDALQKRTMANKSRPGNPKDTGKGTLARKDDSFIRGAHLEIIKRWKKYKAIESAVNLEGQTALVGTFEHLKVIGSPERSSADWSTHMNYVDVLLSLYSCVTSQQETDIVKVENILDPSHYGLEKIKERIYNYLTAKILNPRGKSPTPCFVGPSGVGKTSIGKSIAESLRRKFIRLSLGGIRDEAEIRGHRRTYIGAVPGKIIEQLKRNGVKNPVFMLDEIDKISTDGRGDPAAALLEVLDPEQNHSFRDNYVDVPYDLSEILFLCTANVANKIPHALMDRMEIIPIAGYTEFEKIQIAKKYLIPEQIAETGFPSNKVEIVWPDNDPDKRLSKLICGYTREAGVRGLKREIYRFLSAWNRRYLKIDEDKRPTELLITDELIEELLGLARDHEQVNVAEIGEAIGLAWTEVGGEIMYIHAELTPHIRTEKDISQTGNLSKVFQEANHNALTVVKNLLRSDKQAMDRLRENLLCLSVPDLAIEKDGPSAGIPMAAAIYSELTDKLCRPYLAMTGELTIKGRIRAIGGVKEKILAAQRAGLKEIILPAPNKRNIDKDVPEDIKDDLKFNYVNRIEEVIDIALTKEETPA